MVSTVTAALLPLSKPTQFVPMFGASVYFQDPSGTEDSVHVVVPAELEHEVLTVVGAPPPAGNLRRL